MRSLDIPNAGYSRHFKFLREYRVPVPPLHEQRRIAAILDEADALRATAHRAATRFDVLEDASFERLLGGSIGSGIQLGDITEEFRYGTSQRAGATGLPVLRIPNVTGFAINSADLKTVEIPVAESTRLRLHPRDVLFVRSNGNPDIVGRASAFSTLKPTPGDSTPWVFASYLIRARLKQGIEPRAIAALARSPIARRHLRSGAATSAGQYNISIPTLRSLPVFDPTDHAQSRFMEALRVIDQARDHAIGRAQSFNSLIASLQHRAFRGEL
nr:MULTISPECIES: hypothetical protein [Microbacterium]